MDQVKPNQLPKHFFVLDTVRGFAALAVVLWHWQHFYFVKAELPVNFNISQQPFFKYLYVFYTNGGFAVDFFFSLSGFIFFYLYATKISDKKITGKQFTILRFSRLYPLHFITLIIVLLLQIVAFYNTGFYKVYPYNNFYHFILNLFFLQSWGFEIGTSYNSPSWSVSVEIFLYCLFFLLCWYKLNKKYIIVFLIILGLALQFLYPPLGRGIFSFFLGGIVYDFYLILINKKNLKYYLKFLGYFIILLTSIMILDVYFGFIERLILPFASHMFKHSSQASMLRLISIINHHVFLDGIVFPAVILYLALSEILKGQTSKNLSFIGNISYSSYLLHFPLQLLVMNLCDSFAINQRQLVNRPITMLVFYLVLIVISLISFKYIELPIQNYIRKKLIKKHL